MNVALQVWGQYGCINSQDFLQTDFHVYLPMGKGSHIYGHQVLQSKPTKKLNISWISKTPFLKTTELWVFKTFQTTNTHRTIMITFIPDIKVNWHRRKICSIVSISKLQNRQERQSNGIPLLVLYVAISYALASKWNIALWVARACSKSLQKYYEIGYLHSLHRLPNMPSWSRKFY